MLVIYVHTRTTHRRRVKTSGGVRHCFACCRCGWLLVDQGWFWNATHRFRRYRAGQRGRGSLDIFPVFVSLELPPCLTSVVGGLHRVSGRQCFIDRGFKVGFLAILDLNRTNRQQRRIKSDQRARADVPLRLSLYSRRLSEKALPTTSQPLLSYSASPASPLSRTMLPDTFARSHWRWSMIPFLPLFHTWEGEVTSSSGGGGGRFRTKRTDRHRGA